MEINTDGLLEWAIHMIKANDVHAKKIKSIDKKENKLIVISSDKISDYLIRTDITDINSVIDSLNANQEKLYLITLNTKNNIGSLIKNWASLAKYQNLTIFFANPNSSLEKRWAIKPYFHDKISEKSSLSRGINAMSENVDILILPAEIHN